MSRLPRLLFFALAVGIYAADQITKVLVDRSMVLWESRPVISGFFNLTYVANDGIAFGLFQGNNLLLGCMAAAILAAAIYYARQLDWAKLEVNILGALITAGALGNLTDRIRKGYVIDFLDFHLAGHHWPAFNIADSCITCSVAWLLYRSFFSKKTIA